MPQFWHFVSRSRQDIAADRKNLYLGSGKPVMCRIGCRWPARQRGKDSGSCLMPNGCTWAMVSPAACGGSAAGGQSAAKGEGFRVVLDAERLHLGDGQPCRVRRIGSRWPARQRGKDSGSCSMPNGFTWAMASPAACGGSAARGQCGKGGRIPGRARCRTAGPTITAMIEPQNCSQLIS
jgi:hypothetical protein